MDVSQLSQTKVVESSRESSIYRCALLWCLLWPVRAILGSRWRFFIHIYSSDPVSLLVTLCHALYMRVGLKVRFV